jgi:pyruvate/2-oxoglutarate dehydrogenase complex dihydrolipoamide acyltransferase (E2) component
VKTAKTKEELVTEAPKISQEAQAKAAELGVDLNQVQGTGNEGEIVPSDVDRAAGQSPQGATPSGGGGQKEVTLDPSFGIGEYVGPNGERYVSGVPTPVSDEELNNLERNDEGNLAYPLVEVPKDGES